MKKTIVSAAVLILLLCFSPVAFADVFYPNPSPLEVGQALDHLVASVTPGSQISVSAGALPPGVELVAEEGPDALYLYLRGVPTEAGYYDAILNINGEGSYLCSISVQPSTPQLIVGPSVVCALNDVAQISVAASVADGGQLSYQWYASPGGTGSSMIAGATDSVYQPGTAYAGTTYYYCVVTNNSGGETAEAVSPYISVTVEERTVTAVSVQSMPTKVEYMLGDRLETNGLSLLVSYSNGTSEVVSDGWQLYPTLLDSPGLQTIQVSYAGLVCSFPVSVREEEIVEGIGVLSLPYKTVYTVGEYLDTAGLAIRAYTNQGFRDVSEGLMCSPVQFTQEGSQSVTVTYEGRFCSFTVTVEAEEIPAYLTVYRLPDKTSYTVGDVLDTRGLVLYLISNKNNPMEVTGGYSVSPARLDTPGQQEIAVSYGGFSTSFRVNVASAAAAASPTPIPSATAAPVPAASAEPQPTTAPTEAPSVPMTTSFPVAPAPTASPVRNVGSGKSFVGVIVGASALALSVLGLYVFIMNRGGFDALEDMLERLFRRRKRK